MIVGGYSLHLYCDSGPKCYTWQATGQVRFGDFPGHNERDSRKQAREAGWTFKRVDGEEKCYCKRCSK